MARYETALVVIVSKLYYLSQLKQEEIASRLKISRALVSLILNEAKRMGIIEFKINDPQEENKIVADQLAQFFPDISFIVVPSASKDQEVLREFVVSRAVEVINDQIINQETIGISWGRTCYSIMSSFTARRMSPLSQIVPMVGGSNKNLPRFQLNELVRNFAASMNAQPHFIHAPALPYSQEDFDLFMQSSSMKQICQLWKSINLAILSVGPPPISEEFDGSPVSEPHSERWVGADKQISLPVGNLSARYFDIDGQYVENDIQRRIIGIPFEYMKRIPKVIAIAAGMERVHSVVGALRTGIVKTLVIDELTATAVVELLEKGRTHDLHEDVRRMYGFM